MGKWLHDRPWFWIVLLLAALVLAGLAVVVIAELNRPIIVKEAAAALREAAAGEASPWPS